MSQGLQELITQHGRGIGHPGQREKKRKRVDHAKKAQKVYKRKGISAPGLISHSAKGRRTSFEDTLS